MREATSGQRRRGARVVRGIIVDTDSRLCACVCVCMCDGHYATGNDVILSAFLSSLRRGSRRNCRSARAKETCSKYRRHVVIINLGLRCADNGGRHEETRVCRETHRRQKPRRPFRGSVHFLCNRDEAYARTHARTRTHRSPVEKKERKNGLPQRIFI